MEMAQAPHTAELDEHLKECITAVHGAVNRAIPNIKDEKIVDQALHDCQEVLDMVMEGKVSEWVE